MAVMGYFCTKCGTPADVDARFCADCGAPHKAAAATAATAAVCASGDGVVAAITVPTTPRRVGILIAGGVIAVVAIVGGLVCLMADEAASPEVFVKAINSYYDNNPVAAAKLLCAADLQLAEDPVSVSSFESQRRATMDTLVAAGLYSSPEVQTTGSFFSMQTYRYRRTEAGSRAVKDGKLCVAPAIRVKNVRYELGVPGTKLTALFHYEFKQPEPWLKGDLAKRITRSLDQNADYLAVLELRDGKWRMTTDDPRVAKAVAAGRMAAPQQSLAQRVKSWFRTGNPLIGQWRITNSPWLAGTRVSFSADQAVVDRPNEAVRYEVKGDSVTVHYVARNSSDVFNIQDDDHISLLSDTDVLLLERIKD